MARNLVQLLKDQETIEGKERLLVELWEASKILYLPLAREGGTCPGFDKFEEALFGLSDACFGITNNK